MTMGIHCASDLYKIRSLTVHFALTRLSLHCEQTNDVRTLFMIILKGNQIIAKKVSKGAKIRNRYNQVPHLTQDTIEKVGITNSHLYLYLYSTGPVTALNAPERESVYNVPEY